MSAYQGAFDGLCGQYAISNALELCGLRDNRQSFFEAACGAMPAKRWPMALWKGTTFADLRRMIRHCLRHPANTLGVEACFPFLRNEPRSNTQFWKRFDELFDNPHSVCAVVGLNAPSDHWIVVTPDGGRLAFFDSDPERPFFRKNKASLYAGRRAPAGTNWVLDREAVAIFSVKP